jgi:GTP pyrophosphokinase
MESEFNKNIAAIGEKIYNQNELDFSYELLNELNYLKLDDINKASAFFLKSVLTKNNTKNLILEKFDKKVIDNIELLNRISKVSFHDSKLNVTDLRKLFIELSDDVSIIFIKLAERLVNLRLADKNQTEDIIKLSEEALYFYSPIAQQLGIRKFYHELEDIAFRNLFPDDFAYLDKMIEKKKNIYIAKLNTMKLDLQKIMHKLNITAKYQARVKRPYSIYRKLVKQKIPLDKIFDLLALRVITQTPEQCYSALGAVHSHWIPIEGRFRDWITFPKSNGYRSIQTTVSTRTGDKFEIQIRTDEMHQEAEYGSSAHWAYKQGGQTLSLDWITRLREFLENDEYFDNPYHVFDKLKSEMKRDYINVLTPKGEIRSLPEGATTLDYAFAVHTDLGYKTTGARVNGKFVKLNTVLKSGDVIDIITNNSATPSRDWLNIVKTNRSRSKILRWFKKNEQEIFIAEGKVLWDKLKEKHRKKLLGFEDEPKTKNNLNKFGYKSFEDFYYGISTGAVKCSLFTLKKIFPDAFKKVEGRTVRTGSNKTQDPTSQIKVEGLENIQTTIAKCCNPIKGEPITAYITKRSELKIHSIDCQYLKSQGFDAESFKKAEWLTGEFIQNIRIKIFGDTYSRLLSALVEETENCDIRIIDTVKIPSKSASEGIIAVLQVKDFNQYNKFISKLKSQKYVETVKNG